MKLIISGDFYISDEFKNSELIDKSVLELFNQSDYRIVNLEAPLTENITKNKIVKTGPHLRMSKTTAIKFLEKLKIDAVTMANNHILDYGIEGIDDTFKTLEQNNIEYVGAGKNLSDAAKLLICKNNNKRVAFVNFCEKEWSIAQNDKSGANPMDIIHNTYQIKKAKEIADFVIVIVHGGHEHYHLTSPDVQKRYRFYVEQGADLVVGHHTHCIGGYEEYKGVPIYYSLGNFIFTRNKKNNEWYTGIVLELDLSKEKITHKIHPVRQQKESFQLSLLKGKDLEKILEDFNKYSEIISNSKLLNDHWTNFVSKKLSTYLSYWSLLSYVKNNYFKVILRKIGIVPFSKRVASLYLNLIRCETHNEMSKEVLKKFIHNLNR